MIFASDLDQTLIYSKKHIGDCKDYLLVEKLEDEEISYATTNSLRLLKEIAEKIYFVPATTRTVEQYSRISFFSQTIKPQYAVVCNGGTILVNGVKDKEWDELIKEGISYYQRHSIYEYVREEIYKYYEPSLFKISRVCDEFFWVFVAYSDIEIDERYFTVSKEFKKMGWQLSIQGRKLYAIPEAIDKFKALKYIMSKTSSNELIVSGDSGLDYSMLKNSNIAIVPNHGRVKGLLVKEGINITMESGILAGEEILNFVYRRVSM